MYPIVLGLGGVIAGLVVANATEQPAVINEITEPTTWDLKKGLAVGAMALSAYYIYKKVR